MTSEQSRGGWDFSSDAATPAGALVDVEEPPAAAGRDSSPPPAPPRGPVTGGGGPRYGGGGGRPDGGDALRTVLRGVGQLLITAGMVLLLFVVYELWVSNLFADRKQHQVHQQLATAWRAGQDPLKGQDRIAVPGYDAPIGLSYATAGP